MTTHTETTSGQIATGEFLNTDIGVIGRTASTKTEANTSSRFAFWVGKPEGTDQEPENERLEIGDIVAAMSDDGEEITFGTVVEMRAYSDVDSFIADYLSHNFGDAQLEVPTDVSEVVVVTCAVMRNLSGTARPVGRSRVFYPSALGIRYAYGIVDQSGDTIFEGAGIPIGVFENGDGTVASVSVDEDFLLGPEGAHLNVSGISGLAAKTSAVQFVLRSLQSHSTKSVGIVMFNVKSRDLLYVDRENPELVNDPASLELYEALNITPEPFADASFYAPIDPTDPNDTQSLRELETEGFTWGLHHIRHDIPSLFDSRDWDEKMEGVWMSISDAIEQQELHTYANLLTWVDNLIDRAQHNNIQWPRGNSIYTWHKMRSHLRRFPESYEGLISTAGRGQPIPWEDLGDGGVFVVDIEMLGDRGKKLVFSRAMRAVERRMEQGGDGLDAVVVFVDELNKFAPSGNVRTPLKSRLVDITARGRSIGVVLFGAEQFASSVENEIVENSSTFLFGRTETNELRTPSYKGLSDEVKAKLTMLPQGQLLAKFAKFPQPIFMSFPYPPCMPGDRFPVESEGSGAEDVGPDDLPF